MGNFNKPKEADLQDGNSFGSFVSNQQSYEGGPQRTTASLAGSPTYAATSFNISDILQGAYAVKDPADQLLVINQAATKDLSVLYNQGVDSLSIYGSGAPSSALTGSGAGGSGAGVPGAKVRVEWVNSLPKEHPTTKAILWRSTGKASREMHIPTSGDIAQDKANHKQNTGMKAEWQHPWNMDRVGGGIGGDGGYNTTVSQGETILHGESSNTPGQNGAFGYLSPEDEQYYISMAWPYKGGAKASFEQANEPEIAAKSVNLSQADYKGKRILVYSVEKETACICTPGDWGPQPYWTKGLPSSKGSVVTGIKDSIAGLSPDVHFVLGTDHGTQVILGWVDDSTPLGPYAPTADQALPGQDGGALGAGAGAVSTAPGNVSIDDLKYASMKILNHPNCWMGKMGQRVPGQSEAYAKAFTTHMTNGNGTNTSGHGVFKDSNGKHWLFPSLLNYMWYILEAGFILDYYVGSIGFKMKSGNQSKVSNHATGGAIDINCIGLASEGRVFQHTDKDWRRVADKMFNYLATLPETTRGKEIGCSFEYMYPNNFKVFKDHNPTHIHLGFEPEQTGTLLSVLKKPTANSSNPKVNER